MRDTHAAAMPVEPPEPVLPYDPDDWERRLAEARRRRAAVLRARGAPQDIRAVGADPASVPSAGVPWPLAAPRSAAGRPAGVATPRPDPADWRRKLAEARGLMDDPQVQAGPRHPDRAAAGQTGTATAHPATGDRDPTGAGRRPSTDACAVAALPRGSVGPDPRIAAEDRQPAITTTPQRAVALAALAGLAGGAALTVLLLGLASRDPVPDEAVPGPVAEQAAGSRADPPSASVVLPDAAGSGPEPRRVAVAHMRPPVSVGDPALVTRPAPVAPGRGAVPGQPAFPAAPAVPGAALDPVAPPPAATAATHADVPQDAAMAPPRSGPAPADDKAGGGDAAPFVVVHVPQVPDGTVSGAVMAATRAADWTTVPIGFTISRSHLRVYHDRDRAAAAALGERLGLPVRDFTASGPAPLGLIEIWVAGGPASAR